MGKAAFRDAYGIAPVRRRSGHHAPGSGHRRIGTVLLALAGWLAALAPLPALAVSLTDLEFSSLSGDRTEVRMRFDGRPPQPTGYTIEQPARIVLDLDGVDSALDSKYHSLGIGNARNLTIVEAGSRARVIVNLVSLVNYSTEIRGDTLVLLVGGDEAPPVPTSAEPAPAYEPDRVAITDVDFRRGPVGDGEVVLSLSDPDVTLDVRSEGGNIVMVLGNTTLPPSLQRRLDVTDFATPVRIVDAVEQDGGTVVTVEAAGQYDYLAYQADNQLTLNVKPLTPEEVEEREDVFRFKGEKLSLNFQDIEVRSVLQIIADFTDLNLVASDTVQGRITLRLKNVPWDQALDIVLKTKNLDKRQSGNVLLVAPAAEIAAREKLELENRRQIEELAPLRTEFIQVRYAKAADILETVTSAEGSGAENAILSERGSVIVDERTNSIILTDTADRLAEFRRILRQLDVAVRQVLIEARLVTANSNVSDQLGVRWGGGGLALGAVGGNDIKIGGSRETLGELQDGTNFGTSPGAFTITSPNDLVADLGLTEDTASSIGIGFTGADYLVDLELSALSSDGQAEVIARPKVITADKQPATISSGVQIPFQEATSSGATATQFRDATLSLQVTPQITPDDRIIMELLVTQDSVGQIFNGVPSINTNQIETQILVDNGQTVVLGGVYQTSINSEETKTPFFGDLPFVKYLFRRTIANEDRQELLIFITPRIIEDSLTRR